MNNPNKLTAAKFEATLEWLHQQWQEGDANHKRNMEKAIHQVRLQRELQGFGYGA